jgi:hypothetical protein
MSLVRLGINNNMQAYLTNIGNQVAVIRSLVSGCNQDLKPSWEFSMMLTEEPVEAEWSCKQHGKWLLKGVRWRGRESALQNQSLGVHSLIVVRSVFSFNNVKLDHVP